jgi:hypothetical protein
MSGPTRRQPATPDAPVRAAVPATGVSAPPSFVNDVIPVMARVGCSSGTCHGANSGKGGFKLSLRGYAPELDFLAITRQMNGRRINRQEPEKSLLLRKPLYEVKHGGGVALRKGSLEHRTLLAWLRDGAVGSAEKEPRLLKLAVSPTRRRFAPGERQPLRVRATFSDGRARDVTARALFRSNDLGVAKVSDDGLIAAVAPGATAVQAKYMDQLAVVDVVVPYRQKVPASAFPPVAHPVDRVVHARLRELNLAPSGPATDAEFLRRAFLDVTGTLPTAEEARAFLDSRETDKRAKLVSALLERPEYGLVWAMKLTDLFLVRKEHMGRKNTLAFHQWLAEQFNANRPWCRVVSDMLTVTGPTADAPQALWWVSRQAIKPGQGFWLRAPELSAEVASQVFLGQRIQCAKCHNHPTERYTQEDYYSFTALFAQIHGEGDGDVVPKVISAKDVGEIRHPRTGQVMEPRPLDRLALGLRPGEDRRAKLAAWLTGRGRQAFARAMVNRVWARLFGSGIVEPVDDLRSTNPPRIPALMDVLTREFIASGYDVKRLIATIMASRTYQATSVPTKLNRVDRAFFSRYLARRLSAEELLDAVAQVTGIPDRFATYPVGTRALELSDTEVNSLELDTFGRPPRVMPCDCERSMAPSMSQALALFNSDALQAKLKSGEGTVAALLASGRPDVAIVEELFLACFARRPSAKERAACLAAIARAPNRAEGVQDVLWALINSKEFSFNH